MRSRMPRLEYKYLVAIVFMFGLVLDLMDSTAVNVAVPRLQADFHAPLSTVEWTVTGYLLSLALFIPGAGFLADRLGSKRIFLTAMAVFIVGSALCGQAQSIEQLIAFRILQGIGGGMMNPVANAIISREFPGEERAKASALLAIPFVFAPVLGPILGGYLVESASWRWIFYINLPLGITGFLFGLVVLREHVEPYARGRFDVVGLVTGSVGTAMLLYALSEAANRAWTSPRVAGWGAAGLICLLLFTLIEFRAVPPILDLRLFRSALFTLGTVLSCFSFGSNVAFLFLLTLFLQELQGLSPLHAGLIQGPSALSTALAIATAARWYSRIGPQRMLTVSFLLAVLTTLTFLLLGSTAAAWLIIVLLLLRTATGPFGAVATSTLIHGPLESAKQGTASSIANTLRQTSGSFAVALVATIQVNRFNAHLSAGVGTAKATQPTDAMVKHAQLLSYHDAFLAICVMSLIAFTLSFLVNDGRARAAMSGHHQLRLEAERAGHG